MSADSKAGLNVACADLLRRFENGTFCELVFTWDEVYAFSGKCFDAWERSLCWPHFEYRQGKTVVTVVQVFLSKTMDFTRNLATDAT